MAWIFAATSGLPVFAGGPGLAAGGNDDDARSASTSGASPSRRSSRRARLRNLGLLYEDKDNFPAAKYHASSGSSPGNDLNNERATLYLKDIEATSGQFVDDETLKQQQKLEQLLARPVTDFELSVRSRNRLQG